MCWFEIFHYKKVKKKEKDVSGWNTGRWEVQWACSEGVMAAGLGARADLSVGWKTRVSKPGANSAPCLLLATFLTLVLKEGKGQTPPKFHR